MNEVLAGSGASRYKMISLGFIISLDDRYIGFNVRPDGISTWLNVKNGKLGVIRLSSP